MPSVRPPAIRNGVCTKLGCGAVFTTTTNNGALSQWCPTHRQKNQERFDSYSYKSQHMDTERRRQRDRQRSAADPEYRAMRAKRERERRARLGHDATYAAWRAMIYRCTKLPREHVSWKYYGGADPPVSVCERWMPPRSEGYANFLADMGERPSWANGGLDRINPFGNYEPGNCRWATHTEQMRNRRNTSMRLA